jgi:hypothetical protein
MTTHPLAVECPRASCRSPRVRVRKTIRLIDGRTQRHRICDRCGQEWVTIAPAARESMLRFLPSRRKLAT